jgi:hypothetical protein
MVDFWQCLNDLLSTDLGGYLLRLLPLSSPKLTSSFDDCLSQRCQNRC